VDRALVQERVRLGQAEEEYAEAVALAEVARDAQVVRRGLLRKEEEGLRERRETMRSICTSFLSDAANFQNDCSFESFDRMESSLANDLQKVECDIANERIKLASLQKENQALHEKGMHVSMNWWAAFCHADVLPSLLKCEKGALVLFTKAYVVAYGFSGQNNVDLRLTYVCAASFCSERFTSAAASVESIKSLIATEATQTAALMQKIESARSTFGSEAAKMKKKALEDRLGELTTYISVSTTRFTWTPPYLYFPMTDKLQDVAVCMIIKWN
jgi:hypothetical protein